MSGASAPPLLAVDGLSVAYPARPAPVRAVRDVSFTVARGEVFGLVGGSGSGKSSVLGALVRLLPRGAQVDARSIVFDGRELVGCPDREVAARRGRAIGYVPQQPMTAPTPTASVGRQLRWYFGDRAQSPELQTTLLALGLDAVLDRPDDLPSQFSGGQLQRLVLAIAAYAHEPTLLLADEPTSTLDPTVQARALDALDDVRRALGLTVLFVSHDLGVIARVCDRVGVLADGELVEVAPVDELFESPRHPRTRALLAAATA